MSNKNFWGLGSGGGGRGVRGPRGPAGQKSVVFRPGVASSGIFVATWAEVEAAVNSAQGDIVLYVDSSNAPAIMPAGAVLEGENLLSLQPWIYSIANNMTLVMDVDAKIRNLHDITGSIFVEGTPQIEPMFEWSGAPGNALRILYVREGATIVLNAAATRSAIFHSNPPFLFAPFEVVFAYGARYSDGGTGLPLVEIGGMSTGIFLLTDVFDPFLTQNVFGTSPMAPGTLLYIGDASAPRPSVTSFPNFPLGSIFSLRIDALENITPSAGPTANRPTDLMTGQMYFDTDIGKPVWWTGAQWVDATGVPA